MSARGGRSEGSRGQRRALEGNRGRLEGVAPPRGRVTSVGSRLGWMSRLAIFRAYWRNGKVALDTRIDVVVLCN